jgi:hypothetical protein
MIFRVQKKDNKGNNGESHDNPRGRPHHISISYKERKKRGEWGRKVYLRTLNMMSTFGTSCPSAGIQLGRGLFNTLQASTAERGRANRSASEHIARRGPLVSDSDSGRHATRQGAARA